MASTLSRIIALSIVISSLPALSWTQESPPAKSFEELLGERVTKTDDSFDGNIGVYIESLGTGIRYTYNAGQRYYLASVIKIFVLAEIFRLIEAGRLDPLDEVTITDVKYRDGAGMVNWIPKGGKTNIKTLLDYMIIHSDNAATDILIDIAGISNVDDFARSLGVIDLGPLTSMLDVRKNIYRQLCPVAGNFTSLDFIELWKVKNFEKKLVLFSKMIGKPSKKFNVQELEDAYENFFKSGHNAASLISAAEFFKKLAVGEVVSKKASEQMMELLKKCETGKNRIKSALPEGWEFAHKTGTQNRRVCDTGISFGPQNEKVVILICAEHFSEIHQAEEVMGKVATDFFDLYKKDGTMKEKEFNTEIQ